jgi:hypothetical protein
MPLSDGSVADFYASFCDVVAGLGIHRPGSSLICEIPGAPPHFEDDTVRRSWDRDTARLMWRALNLAADGLEAWQAPFLGHRPRVGVMWGGFDLSATRHRALHTAPPPKGPPFMQNAQLNAYVSVGFSFDNTKMNNAPVPPIGMYAYIWPQPDGLEGRSYGVEGADWYPEAGLMLLPWDSLRRLPDPRQAIVKFGDAVYQAAVETAGWPTDVFVPRVDGWYVSRTPAAVLQEQEG